MNYLANLNQEIEIINVKTILFRNDLKSDDLISEAVKMAHGTLRSPISYLLEFQKIASEGRPMPWES